MADRFSDRVAALAGETTRALNEVITTLRAAGLTCDAELLASLSESHTRVAIDYLEETQPLVIARDNFEGRLRSHGARLQEISADMLALGDERFHSVATLAGALVTLAESARD